MSRRVTERGAGGHEDNVELCAPSPGPGCVGVIAASERAGDTPPTFERIYQGYFDFAWRNLRRLGVPTPQLDDAVQDTFIVVHRRLADFEGRSSLGTWLASICWRVASDYRRASSRRGDQRPFADDIASDGPDPQQAAAESEALRQVDRLLQQLDDEKRTVFVLTEMEGMSAPEIAEALGVKLNTVYSRLRAARRAFDLALEQQREGER